MTKKIFRSIVIVAASVLLASLVIISSCFYEYFGRLQRQEMKDELYLAATAVEHGGDDYLKNISSGHFRLSLIAKDGSVLYDTAADAESPVAEDPKPKREHDEHTDSEAECGSFGGRPRIEYGKPQRGCGSLGGVPRCEKE